MSKEYDYVQSFLNIKKQQRERIEQAEREIELSKVNLIDHARVLLDELPDNEALRLATEIYWFHPEINVGILSSRFGVTSNMFYKLVPKAYIIISCRGCKREFKVYLSSRSSQCPTSYLCESCNRNQQIEYQQQAEQTRKTLQELKTMPYAEYLKTEHWQQIRNRSLRHAGYRCQICNAKDVPLNVHHRTYERRGEEITRDLIVLCKDCHELFHNNKELHR
jgi:5-methylcytosine-specific restriction endonuclease McrA